MEKFHELPRWVQFGLAALLALVMLFAMVFEVSLPVFAPVPGATDVAIGAQGAVRERIAIDTREDSYFYSGADLYFYSDDHSTQKFHVDGATGNVDAEGTANFAGAVTLQSGLTLATADLNGTALTIDADADTTLVASTDDVVSVTLGAATGYVKILTGSLAIGNGTPGGTINGEDLYVEGYTEIDGELELDGALDADSTADIADTLTLSKGSGTALVVGAGGLADFGGNLVLENDETVSNSTDGVVQVGGFLALTEGAVVEVTAAGTITPLASFQPITSSTAITNAVLADGTVAGQLLVIINENASDDITILETGSNLDAGGDITLTGGALDALTLLWDGAQWVRLSFEDN